MATRIHIRERNGLALCGASLVMLQGDLLKPSVELIQPATKFLIRSTCAKCRSIRIQTNARVSP